MSNVFSTFNHELETLPLPATSSLICITSRQSSYTAVFTWHTNSGKLKLSSFSILSWTIFLKKYFVKEIEYSTPFAVRRLLIFTRVKYLHMYTTTGLNRVKSFLIYMFDIIKIKIPSPLSKIVKFYA